MTAFTGELTLDDARAAWDNRRREELAAKAEAVSAWGQAADGLLAALSWAKSGYAPPDPAPSGYTTPAEFAEWAATAQAVWTFGSGQRWAVQAACRDSDPVLFHPEAGHSDEAAYAAAIRVCAGCPVRAECLDEAMRRELKTTRFGVWGGTTPSERRRLAAGVPS